MRSVTVFVLICGTWFVIDKQITYGEFIAFVLLTNVFLGPIQKINNVIESYPKGIAGFKRYVEVIDTEPEVADHPNAMKVDHLDGQIKFDGVSFGYGDEARVLNNISLSIRAGETVAFVGPSGAGKTTICSLLPRFYDVSEGSIAIDGIDIRRSSWSRCAARSASCSRMCSCSPAPCGRTSRTASSARRMRRSGRRRGARSWRVISRPSRRAGHGHR